MNTPRADALAEERVGHDRGWERGNALQYMVLTRWNPWDNQAFCKLMYETVVQVYGDGYEEGKP